MNIVKQQILNNARSTVTKLIRRKIYIISPASRVEIIKSLEYCIHVGVRLAGEWLFGASDFQ